MQKNGAWFSRAQEIERKFEGTKVLWPVDQNGIAILQTFRQDFT